MDENSAGKGSWVLHEHGSAANFSVLHILHRICEPLERVSDGRRRSELSRFEQRKNLLHALCHQVRCALSIITDLETTDLDILKKQVVRLDRWDPAGGKADDDDTPPPCDRTQGGIERVAADRVDDDIHSVATVFRIDLL